MILAFRKKQIASWNNKCPPAFSNPSLNWKDKPEGIRLWRSEIESELSNHGIKHKNDNLTNNTFMKRDVG